MHGLNNHKVVTHSFGQGLQLDPVFFQSFFSRLGGKDWDHFMVLFVIFKQHLDLDVLQKCLFVQRITIKGKFCNIGIRLLPLQVATSYPCMQYSCSINHVKTQLIKVYFCLSQRTHLVIVVDMWVWSKTQSLHPCFLENAQNTLSSKSIQLIFKSGKLLRMTWVKV